MNPKQSFISSMTANTTPSVRKKPLDVQGIINKATTPYSAQFTGMPKNQSVPSTPIQKPVTSAPGATALAPTAITPPKQPSTSLQSPAAQQYIQSQAGTGSFSDQLNAAQKQAERISAGIKTMTPAAPERKDSAYVEYLKTMFNPESTKLAMQEKQNAQKNLADINQELVEQSTESRRRYADTITASGGLKSGTQAGATSDRRRSNEELADISLRQLGALGQSEAATSAVNDYVAAGKELEGLEGKQLSIEEAQTLGVPFGTSVSEARALGITPQAIAEAFTLGEGQARYDAEGNVIAQRAKKYASKDGMGSGTGGANISPTAKNIIALINQGANIDDLIKGTSVSAQQLRNEVFAGLNEQGGLTTRSRELFTEAKSAVDNLLQGGYKSLGGYSSRLGGQFTTAYGDAKARAQQLEAILARDNLGLLKGAMSDKDLSFIQSMSSGFQGEGIQSDAFIKGRLEEIQTKLQKRLGEEEQGGGQPEQMQLEDGTIVTLQADGTYE